MKSIDDKLIVKLYNWTRDDLNFIFDKCFIYNHIENRLEGPSNSYAIILASTFDLWGSIIRDEFGNDGGGETKKNIKKILEKIINLKSTKKDEYLIFNENNKLNPDITKIFRHNLAHNFGKGNRYPGCDLNIDCTGPAMNYQGSNERWHFNCEKLKQDLLNAIRIALPDILKGIKDDKEEF